MGRQTQAQWDAKRAAAKAKAREALAKAAEDEPTTAPEDPEVLPYETWSDDDLFAEFTERGLDPDALGQEDIREGIIKDLEADDENTAE